MQQTTKKQLGIAAVLVLLMAATRMHHFGDATHLPDASLAIFVLAGFFIASPLFFAGLLLEAGLLDLLATNAFAVSDWCMTPAYGFLVPTYGVLWMAGRWYAGKHQATMQSLAQFTAVSFAALSSAFVISNLSFFAFSGRYDNMGLAEYCVAVAKYYPEYVAGGALYLSIAVVIYAAVTTRTTLAKG